MNKYTIENEGRLDIELSYLCNLSRSQLASIIKKGVYLNSKLVTKAGTKVKKGDVVEFDIVTQDKEFKKVPMEIDVIYEDNDILVINKPRGLVVHPGQSHYDDTLVNGLAFKFDKDEEDFESDFRMGIVHRIDKDTSGLLVIAKNLESKQILSEMVANHQVDRSYITIASGFFPKKYFKVDAPIGRDSISRQKMAVTDKGKNSITHFKVIKQFNGFAILDCKLETGRTHQIRVHLAFIKHPIVGDQLYSSKKYDFANNGQLLHAYKLVFNHPKTNKKMTFYAPLDDYFKKAFIYIRNNYSL